MMTGLRRQLECMQVDDPLDTVAVHVAPTASGASLAASAFANKNIIFGTKWILLLTYP
jgi:hypothetical protein